MKYFAVFLLGIWVWCAPASAIPISVGPVTFEASGVDARNFFNTLVVANVDGKNQIVGQDSAGQLYRLTPSFSSLIIEATKGDVIMAPAPALQISFGGRVSGVPLQPLGESAGAQTMMVNDETGVSATYTLPMTEVFVPSTAQVIDLNPQDSFQEIAVVTFDQDNTSALSIFFKIGDRLARVLTLPQSRHTGLMDFVGLDSTRTPPVLATVQDPAGTSYLTMYRIEKGEPKVIGKFYGFASVIPETTIRPLTIFANVDGEEGNEVISFRNDLKTLAFFQYRDQGLTLLRQQTFSAPVASGITLLKDNQDHVQAIGFMGQDGSVMLLIRTDG